jgi:lipid-A-disaccharide synthase-like uncharacterized protein
MEAIQEILTNVGSFLAALGINPMYVLLWVAAGYIQKTYLSGYTKLGPVWKTFLLGSLFSLVYAFLLREPGSKKTWVEFAASYLFATSMYELWIKDTVNLLIQKLAGIFQKKLES